MNFLHTLVCPHSLFNQNYFIDIFENNIRKHENINFLKIAKKKEKII